MPEHDQEEFAEQVGRPEGSRFYEVRHEQLDELPEHERKSGPPSPTPVHDRQVLRSQQATP